MRQRIRHVIWPSPTAAAILLVQDELLEHLFPGEITAAACFQPPSADEAFDGVRHERT